MNDGIGAEMIMCQFRLSLRREGYVHLRMSFCHEHHDCDMKRFFCSHCILHLIPIVDTFGPDQSPACTEKPNLDQLNPNYFTNAGEINVYAHMPQDFCGYYTYYNS